MTRVGRSQTRQTECPEPDAGRRTEGEALVFASGGDEIYVTYAGRVVPGVGLRTVELTYLAIGGTGRFARAEGEIVVSVIKASPAAFVGRGEGSVCCGPPDLSPR